MGSTVTPTECEIDSHWLHQGRVAMQELGQMVFDPLLPTNPRPHLFQYGWKSLIEVWLVWVDFTGSCLRAIAWLIQPLFAIHFNSRGASIIVCA